MSKQYYIEVHRTVTKGKVSGRIHFWSRIKSRNGKIVWTSETYLAKQNAVRPVNKLIEFIGKKNCSLRFFE